MCTPNQDADARKLEDMTGPNIRAPHTVKTCLREASILYRMKEGYFALHDMPNTAYGAELILELDEGRVRIYKGDPPQFEPAIKLQAIGPVYALEPAGIIAAPTGRVLVRFDKGRVEDWAAGLAQCGYRVEQTLRYAPQAAWVRPSSGSIVDSIEHRAA